MDQNSVMEKVISIVSIRSGHPIYELCNTTGECLLGPRFRVPARELLHILFDIEGEFSITVNPEDLSGFQFTSIDNIVSIVIKHLA